jgi:hypothetical protein
MERYKNLSGTSGARGYEIGTNSIIVQFHDNSIYEYTYDSAGANNIEQMKNWQLQGWD